MHLRRASVHCDCVDDFLHYLCVIAGVDACVLYGQVGVGLHGHSFVGIIGHDVLEYLCF